MRRGRWAAVAVAAALVAAACTGGDDDAAVTSPPSTPPGTAAEVTPESVAAEPEDTIIDTVDELEELDDVVAEAPPPETRTEELAEQLADGDAPTVQQAVDLFDIVYGPFPGATPTDLPPGEGLGTSFTLWAIEQVRDQLAADQLAALEAIESDVEDEFTIQIDSGGATAVEGTADPDGAPATTAPPPTAPTAPTAPSTSAQGLRTRQDATLQARYSALAVQATNDWLRYAPRIDAGLALPPVVIVQVVGWQARQADMDAFPYPGDRRYCRVRVFPKLWRDNPDDITVRYAFAHELFHCVQFQWSARGGQSDGWSGPHWLGEGSASFAMFDLYRTTFEPPARYADVNWFRRAGGRLDTREYDAWPLFEAVLDDNRDVYGSIRSMVRSRDWRPEELLQSGQLDGVLFRSRWGSTSTRATRFGGPEWKLQWPSTSGTGGPYDNTVHKGTRGLGTYQVVGSADYGHQTQQITIANRVGLVVATPRNGPLTTWTADGTVVVAEGSPATFCFSPDGCACPGGRSSGAHPMDGREMVFSFPAGRVASSARVHAVEWNPEKQCKDEPRTDRASSNGDPHLISFDGLAFDVHAPGELVLVRDTGADDLEVQVRHEPWPLFGSGNTAVAVGVDGRRITFTAESLDTDEPPVVRVDGDVVDTTTGVEVGDVVVTGDPTGTYPVWDVRWSDGTALYVRWYLGWSVDLEVAVERLERLEGLLGAANGDIRDDLALGDGTLLSPEEQERIDTEYVEPWFVDDDTTLFDYAPGQSPRTFRDAERPPLPPRPDEATTDRCASALGDEATRAEIEACAFDVTVTGEDGYAEFHATVVERRVEADPNPVVVVVTEAGDDDEPEPGATPSSDGAALVLAGTLWDGFSLIDDPDAVGELTGALELEEGAVVVARADRCPTDVDVLLDITERGSDAGAATVRVCDAYGFNGATAGDQAEVFAGESYALITSSATYDFALTTDSATPVFVSIAVFADPTPTVVDGATARSDGVRVTLDGVADSVVMLLQTDTGAAWAASGLDLACGGEVYGPALGEGGAWTIAFCDHTGDEVAIGPTGDLAVPVVAFARTDEPVTVELRPTG